MELILPLIVGLLYLFIGMAAGKIIHKLIEWDFRRRDVINLNPDPDYAIAAGMLRPVTIPSIIVLAVTTTTLSLIKKYLYKGT